MQNKIKAVLSLEPKYEVEIIKEICSSCTKKQKEDIRKWLKQLEYDKKIKYEDGRYGLCKA